MVLLIGRTLSSELSATSHLVAPRGRACARGRGQLDRVAAKQASKDQSLHKNYRTLN